MRPSGTGVLVFLCLGAVALAMVWQTLPPAPLPASAPAAEFSAARAIEHIRIIAQQPHPVGSAANAAVRDYILAELIDLGLEAETQRDGQLENVMARFAGTQAADAVLLTAHYDSTLQSPGASDDASGVAALLETARALRPEAPMRNTIMFLFTDHEEGGWFGAKAFIARHPWARDVRVVIGFDAGGVRGPAVLSATSPNNGWLIRQLIEADPYLVGSSAITALADSRTDFGYAFRAAGFSGYAFDYYWDKRDGPEDNLAQLNPSSVQHQGYHALSLARHFGNLDPLADPKEPDPVYFSLLRLFVVSYSPAWAAPLAVAVAGVFVAVLVYGLRRSLLSWRGMGYGTFVLFAGVMTATLPYIILEFFIGRWIPSVTADYDHRLLDQPPEVSAMVLISLALTVLWYALAQRIRQTSLPDLTLGALAPLVVGMAGTSLALPALSYGFTWPLLISLMAHAHWFYGHARRKSPTAAILGLLLSGAVSILVAGPAIVLGVFDQLWLALATLGALCGLLVPQIHLILGGTLAGRGA